MPFSRRHSNTHRESRHHAACGGYARKSVQDFPIFSRHRAVLLHGPPESIDVVLADLVHVALPPGQLSAVGPWILKQLLNVADKLRESGKRLPFLNCRRRRRRVDDVGGGYGGEERRLRRTRWRAKAFVVHRAKVGGLHAGLSCNLVNVRKRRSRQLRLARVHKGAFVLVLQRLPRVIDKLELRLLLAVLANQIPIFPEGKAKHSAFGMGCSVAAGRRIELQLLM
mmetsp:Transcript_5626/g.12241  ORF Transcript_5626/g.12241 Transcript_5626/m.12241 type:complete len:225 (+) Transcript_5626:338-1012(+)